MPAKDIPRLFISAVILLLFAYVVVNHYSVGVEETLKAIVLLAVGYWLGSSKGSSDKSTQLHNIAEQASGKPDDPVHTIEETK